MHVFECVCMRKFRDKFILRGGGGGGGGGEIAKPVIKFKFKKKKEERGQNSNLLE